MASSAPYQPLGHAPLRRPRSVRRTTSLQASWPQGRDGPVQLAGVARDLFTPEGDRPAIIVAQDWLSVTLDAERKIGAIHASREVPALPELLGHPSISGLRGTLAQLLHDEAASGSPLYSLLEDIPGVSLVCNFAWARWPATRAAEMRFEERSRQQMRDVCAGFASGSSSLTEPPAAASRQLRVPPLVHPLDPLGWHALPASPGVDMCRVRRLDVWMADGLLHADTMFQDSAAAPENTREAAHEYALQAAIDIERCTLHELQAQPHILPYRECPGAVANLRRIAGVPLCELRHTVLGTLRRTDGCTHLNDAVRALAAAQHLSRPLRHFDNTEGRLRGRAIECICTKP